MGRVNTSDLQAGMIVAEDVHGSNGRLLLSRGVRLDAARLRVLRIWGVADVLVEQDGPAAPGRDPAGTPRAVGSSSAETDAAAAHAAAIFSASNTDHPAVAELVRLKIKALESQDVPRAIPGQQCLVPAPPADCPADLPPAPATPEALLASDPGLHAFPDVYFKLKKALDDPSSSTAHIAEVVSRDPALTSSLLKLANSPLYGFPKRVESLSRGVMMIGATELCMLAMGLSVMGMFAGIPTDILTTRQIWSHAVGCGVLSRIIAARLHAVSRERCFVAGLLHDVGRLILLKRQPRHMARVFHLARLEKTPLIQAERRLFGYDHTQVAAAAVTAWKLPPLIGEAIRLHHDPAGSPDSPLEASVVHLADLMTIALEIGSNGSCHVPPLCAAAWERLGLSASALEIIAAQADRQVEDIVITLLP